MAHRTVQPTTGESALPPDIATMRASTALLLTDEAQHSAEELGTLTITLRGHIELLIPEVEKAAGRLPKDDVPRYCALACVGEARMKLRVTPKPGLDYGTAHARRLARALNALCDHYENLGGAA